MQLFNLNIEQIQNIPNNDYTLYFDSICNKSFCQTLRRIKKKNINNFFCVSDEKAFKHFNIINLPTQITFLNKKECQRLILK